MSLIFWNKQKQECFGTPVFYRRFLARRRLFLRCRAGACSRRLFGLVCSHGGSKPPPCSLTQSKTVYFPFFLKSLTISVMCAISSSESPCTSKWVLATRPIRQSILTEKKSAIFAAISREGITLSFSQFDTHCLVTPIILPNSTWFNPRANRMLRMFSLKLFILFTPQVKYCNTIIKYPIDII